MFKENKEKTKGITLIALVVTVVILVILASISINLVLNSGLVNRSQNSKELHELQREKERLELIKGEVASDTNHVGKVTVDTYVEELINQGITTEGETTDNGDGSNTVITDTGYSVLIEPKGEKDVEIIIEGKAGQLPPRIKKVELERDEEGTKLTVKVDAVRTECATYKYYYKTVGGEYGEAVYIGENANYTIENVSKDETYTVKVEASNEYGMSQKETNEFLGSSSFRAGTYIWYEKPDGDRLKCFILHSKGNREHAEACAVTEVATYSVGVEGKTSSSYSQCQNSINNFLKNINEVPQSLLNPSMATFARALYTKSDGSSYNYNIPSGGNYLHITNVPEMEEDILQMKELGFPIEINGDKVLTRSD